MNDDAEGDEIKMKKRKIKIKQKRERKEGKEVRGSDTVETSVRVRWRAKK